MVEMAVEWVERATVAMRKASAEIDSLKARITELEAERDALLKDEWEIACPECGCAFITRVPA